MSLHIFIRKPLEEDWQELLALHQKSKEFHYPWVSAPCTEDGCKAYINRCQNQDFEGLLICHAIAKNIVGVANLSQIFYGGFQNAYLGYYVDVDFAGQGFMLQGIRLTVSYAFYTLGLHRVEANIQPENTASIRLVQRLGFTKAVDGRYVRDGCKKRNKKCGKSLYSHCVSTVKTVPSMVHLRPYKSVVLGCDGDDIGEAFTRYPAHEDCIIPSTWVKAHFQRLILLETRETKMKKKQKSSIPNCQSVAKTSKLNPIHPNAAGIDIGSQHHWVCVPSGSANECVRRFGCYTADLYAIADWLAVCGVETVAMESTGVYWIPLFQILETRSNESEACECSPCKNFAWTQNRCFRLSMAATVA